MSQSALSKTCPAPSASLPSGAPSRRGDLDIARAVAALAVILHHIGQYFWLGDFPHFNPAIGRVTVEAVSYIHIPVFMFVAGIVLSLRPPQVADLLEYRRFEFQKMCRLMLPFVAISILHALVKVASPGKAMALLPDQALHSLIAPRGGLAGHLWFLYCLMSIFLVWPLVSTLGRKHMILLVAVLLGLAVAAVPWPLDPMDHGHPLAGLADLAWYLPIYVIGFWYGRSGASAVPRSPAVILGAGAVLVAAFWVHVSVSFGETFGEQTISRAIHCRREFLPPGRPVR